MKRLLAVVMALALAGCAAPVVAQSGQGSTSPSIVVAPHKPTAGTPKLRTRPAPTVPKTFRMWKFSAPVVTVILRNGVLIPPSDPSVLGWWGQKVGSKAGTTLLTGHTVHTGGGDLNTLYLTPVGSTAVVSGIRYRVVSVVSITKAELAKQGSTLFEQTGRPQLVVVTCDIRTYNPTTHEYANNTVVTATLETP